MLELGPRELLTLGTVLAGIATTWGVLKTTIRSMTSDQEDIKKEVYNLNNK